MVMIKGDCPPSKSITEDKSLAHKSFIDNNKGYLISILHLQIILRSLNVKVESIKITF